MKSPSSKPEIVTRNGKAVAVIVPIGAYEELLERAEDASDLKWLKRARAGKLQYSVRLVLTSPPYWQYDVAAFSSKKK